MADDMGKPAVEAWLTDVAAVRRDIDYVDRHLDRWAAPSRVRVPWQLQPGRASTVPEPLGAVLVLGPWNYPVRCLVLPAAFALAAGNAVAAKPSELAPATSAELARLLPRYVDERALAVVQGGPPVAEQLLAQRWDHVFFTGGGRVGRLVMRAAAEHLTPVTLELGGKNPAIVDRSADVPAAARRLAWGKFLNGGQTCVGPDYLVVHAERADELVEALKAQVARFFGPDPSASADFARIVNDAHFDRLASLLARTRGRTAFGGQIDAQRRYVAPTLVEAIGWDDPLMEEEIFGPVLPVLVYEEIDDVLHRLRSADKPLAVYVYTTDDALVRRIVEETSSGSVCVNHNALQLAVPELPFGGVGASGMGAYHGRAGFETFSHRKAVLVKRPRAEVPLVYPPYSRFKRWVLRRAA